MVVTASALPWVRVTRRPELLLTEVRGTWPPWRGRRYGTGRGEKHRKPTDHQA